MINNVLLAADLSPLTPHLLRHATDLANQHDAKLMVVHAVEPLGTLGHALLKAYVEPETTRLMTTTGLDAMMHELKAQVIDTLTEQHLGGSIDLLHLCEVIVRSGPPADIIMEVVEEYSADLLVMGRHSLACGSTGQLGSVAQKLLSNATIPVYLAPNEPGNLPLSRERPQIPLW